MIFHITHLWNKCWKKNITHSDMKLIFHLHLYCLILWFFDENKRLFLVSTRWVFHQYLIEPRLELVSLIALIINSIILETGWIIEAWFHITNYSVSHQNVKASKQSSILYYCNSKISPSIGYYGKKMQSFLFLFRWIGQEWALQ